MAELHQYNNNSTSWPNMIIYEFVPLNSETSISHDTIQNITHTGFVWHVAAQFFYNLGTQYPWVIKPPYESQYNTKLSFAVRYLCWLITLLISCNFNCQFKYSGKIHLMVTIYVQVLIVQVGLLLLKCNEGAKNKQNSIIGDDDSVELFFLGLQNQYWLSFKVSYW